MKFGFKKEKKNLQKFDQFYNDYFQKYSKKELYEKYFKVCRKDCVILKKKGILALKYI